MANIDPGSNDGKKGKPKRQLLRVDFTPMVDMNMLLITFFMFCTTLSIPQVMDIAMPTDMGEQLVPQSKSVTVLLDENDKVYYYEGLADYEDYTSLKETNTIGLRKMLLERNAVQVSKINDLRLKRHKKQISESDFKAQLSQLKKDDHTLNVLLKPTAQSNYKNLVDALDEMQICGVDKYTIVDPADGDYFLLENYKTKGSLTAMAKRP